MNRCEVFRGLLGGGIRGAWWGVLLSSLLWGCRPTPAPISGARVLESGAGPGVYGESGSGTGDRAGSGEGGYIGPVAQGREVRAASERYSPDAEEPVRVVSAARMEAVAAYGQKGQRRREGAILPEPIRGGVQVTARGTAPTLGDGGAQGAVVSAARGHQGAGSASGRLHFYEGAAARSEGGVVKAGRSVADGQDGVSVEVVQVSAISGMEKVEDVGVLRGGGADGRDLRAPAGAIRRVAGGGEAGGGQAAGPVEASPETVVARLERRLREKPEDTSAALALYHLYLAQDEPAKARALLASDPEQANETLAALERLRRQVAKSADLRIAGLKICQEVKGFGRYTEVDEQVLSSGSPRGVYVYFELENFASERNGEGQYSSSIRAQIVLVDEDNEPVVSLPWTDVPDTPSFSAREDFYLRALLKVPTLKPGKYRFTVQAEDKLAQKRALPRHYRFEVKARSVARKGGGER